MATKSDFMAAEEIKAILSGRDKNEQERILRWVSESIGIAGVPSTASGNLPQQVSPPVAAPGDAQAILSVGGARPKDIKSFVAEKAPKNDVQFATVVAYFYHFEASEAERKDVIVPQDLQSAGRQARGFGFKNAIKTLNNAVALGYFDRAGRGEFKLNAVGENLVAMTLPSGDIKRRKPSRSKQKRSNTARRGRVNKRSTL